MLTGNGRKVLNKIYVMWEDHFSSGGWKDIDEEVNSDRRAVCETVGFLLSENKQVIKIALSICKESNTCAHVVTILKKNVLKRKKL